MVGWLNIWMDGWTDAVLTLGFFLDILHVRKVAKKILSFSKYSTTRTQYVYIGSKSTSSHSCVRRDGRTDEWMDGQTENTDVLTDGCTYGQTDG